MASHVGQNRVRGVLDDRRRPLVAKALALGDEVDLSRFKRGSGWVVTGGAVVVERDGKLLAMPSATSVIRTRHRQSPDEGPELSGPELDTPQFDTPELSSETFQETCGPSLRPCNPERCLRQPSGKRLPLVRVGILAVRSQR